MIAYDPELAPESGAWLELDESARIRSVEAHHRAAGITPRNPRLHAAMHAVVETQLAEEMETVNETVARLCAEGLSRHEAVHAVGIVLVSHLAGLVRPESSGTAAAEDYFRALRALTAAGCRRPPPAE